MNVDFRSQVSRAGFRATPKTRSISEKTQRTFGFKYNYEPLRLFLARSLLVDETPRLANIPAKQHMSLRGEQLFGANELDVWVSVLIEAMQSTTPPTITELRTFVETHIDRGAGLFKADADKLHWSPREIAASLGRKLPSGGRARAPGSIGDQPMTVALGLVEAVGEAAVEYRVTVNRVSEPPHWLLLGRDAGDRTEALVNALIRLRDDSDAPTMVIDCEGGLARRLVEAQGGVGGGTSPIVVIDAATDAVPLNLFADAASGAIFAQASVHQAIHALQRCIPSLRKNSYEAFLTTEAMNRIDRGGQVTLNHLAQAFSNQFRQDKDAQAAVADLAPLAAVNSDSQLMDPAKFFGGSWLIDVSTIGSGGAADAITLMVTQALAAWVEAEGPLPGISAHRQLGLIMVINGARRLLAEPNNRALEELMGGGWSRGVLVMLATTGADDLQHQPREMAENIGTAIAFSCPARRGMRLLGDVYGRKLLTDEFSGANLPTGVALVAHRGRAPTVVRTWAGID